MSPDGRLAEIRTLSELIRAGRSPQSFVAVQKLFQLLLAATVLADGHCVTLTDGQSPNDRMLAGRGRRPLKLRDGRYLRLTMALALMDTPEHGRRLMVTESSYQYQNNPEGRGEEIFRYDYVREPGPDPHPTAHLNIHGRLDVVGVLGDDKSLHRVHFPTARVSLEAVIRCLVEQFGVSTRDDRGVCRALLAAAEDEFREIAHQPPSGPDN